MTVQAPDVEVAVDYEDKLQMEEMDVSSTEESELESDTEGVSRLARTILMKVFFSLQLFKYLNMCCCFFSVCVKV